MKAVIKRLVCSVLLVLILISAVPASALDINFDEIDWDVIGGMFGIPEDQLEDLKDLVSNLDEESLDQIVSEALGSVGGSDESDESEESDDPDVSDDSDESEESDGPGSGIVIPVLKNYVAVIGGSGLKAFYPTLSEAIANASKSEVVFVIDARGLDDEIDASCQIIFDKNVDTSSLKVAKDYAVIEGSYVFGSTSYSLFMVSKVSDALESAVSDLDGINDGYSASFTGSDDQYTLTLTVNVSDIADLASGAGATVNAIAEAIMPAFPLFDNFVVGENQRVVYDGKYFYMDAMDALISDLLAKQTKGGIYKMAFEGGNTFYTFPMTMQYQADKAVEMDVVVKVNATDAQMSKIKAGMRKAYDRLYIEDLGAGAYTVNANVIGLFRAIAEEAGLLTAYDIVTEDGLRAVLDDVKVEWICKAVMAYNGAQYADAADALQGMIGKFMNTEEYKACKDNRLGDCYAGNGVYTFSFDGSYNYSGMLDRVAEKTASFGYDYAKLAEMCQGDTTITRSFNFVITAYATTRLESANDVIEGVLDALDAVSGNTAYVIERQYTDGVISGLNFVIQPGSAEDLLAVVTKNAAFDVITSLVPVCLVFDEAAINGKTVFDRDGSIAWKDTAFDLYNDYSINFTYLANLETKTVLTFDLHLENGEVALDIPVSITLGVSDDNFAKLKKVAAKLADIVTVDGDLTATDDRFAASIDVTVDLRDDLDLILNYVAIEGVTDSYATMRSKMHEMSLQNILDEITLDKLQAAAAKAGVEEQFNKLVIKLANRFGLDTTEPCNYEDLIAILDANRYYQTYVKARLEAKLDKVDVDALLATKIGDFYRNDGTYTVSLSENYDGIVVSGYADRVIDALVARFNGDKADKIKKAIEKLGYGSVEEVIEKVKARYATYYYAQYDLDVNATLLLFHVYTVTFVDENGVVLAEQKVVAGDNAELLLDYHGGPFYYNWEGDIGNVTEDRTIVIRKHCDADGNWYSWIEEVTTDATCAADGKTEWICTVCGEVVDSETIPETDIHGTTAWNTTKEPTCTEDGEKVEYCTVCGDILATETIPATGHTAGAWVVVTDPTCTVEGKKVQYCSVCGDIVAEEAIPALGHKFETLEEVDSSCTEKGILVEMCSVCHKVQTTFKPVKGHTLVQVEYVAPTCEVDGTIKYECSVCSELVEVSLPHFGHSDGVITYEWTNGASKSNGVYSCTATLYCKNDPSHVLVTETVVVDPVVSVDPACEELGEELYTAIFNDSRFATQTQTKALPAIGHEPGDWVVVDEATCTEDGLQQQLCKHCANEVMDEAVIPATGHDWSDWKVTDATCTANGNKTRTCSACGDVETEILPATGHTAGEWVVTDATCTKDGLKTLSCKTCGKELDREIIPALGHTWGEWVVTDATCTANGNKTRTCSACGDVEPVILPATGHTAGEWVVTDATCTEDGLKTLCCATCCKELDREIIPAIGHDWSEWTVVDATCIKDGSKTRTCATCGETDVVVIPANGAHTAGEWETVKSATCTENGEKVLKCSVCGEVLATETIDAIGHNYVTTETEGVDCHTPYKKVTACTNCGDVKEEIVTDLYRPTLKADAEDLAFLSDILVVKVAEMTVDTFKSNFYCGVTVYDKNGKQIEGDALVGTNCTFVCDVCGEVFEIAEIGDVTGDGKVNAKDYMMIKRYVLGTFELKGAALVATDVNVDLHANAKDYLMVKMYVLGNYDFYENVPDWEEVTKLIIDEM